MKAIFRNILIVSVVLGLNAAPVALYAMPEPVPATQTDKQKAAEKKKKEQEKAKAAKEKEKAQAAKAKEKEQAAKAKEKEKAAKEKEKAQAAKEKEKEQAAKAKEKEQAAKEKEREQAAKAKEKEQAAKEKEQAAKEAERAKVAAEREEAKAKKEAEIKAKEEKALREYEKYQEEQANPKTEAISYVNLGLRAGYAAMMDKIDGAYMGAGTLNQSNALQQLKGGGGAGLDLTYNLEYGHFLFETGLDFRFLNSSSIYGFTAVRPETTYGAIYYYLFDNLSETRNMAQVGVPLMFGAQFNRYYFLLGAKIGYSLMGSYSQKGLYDIVVDDPALLEPYGMGIHNLNNPQVPTRQAIVFKQPEVSLAAEVGVDLDEWLQAQPDTKKKQKQKVQPGQRLPFGREHIHYRASLFAEYGVLNTNGTPNASPVEYAADKVEVQNTNTLLAMNGSKLNNLFVGAKFTIQFEVPGKKERPVPPPPSHAIYSIVDETTNEPLQLATIEVREDATGKITLREKPVTPKGFKQKCALGAYTVEAKAENYYPATHPFVIEQVGSTEYVTIPMRHRPYFRVRVINKETGLVVPANVQIRKRGEIAAAHSLETDSVNGKASIMLEDGLYSLHIAQMGYDTLDTDIAFIGDSMLIELTPVKKGEVFIVKNLFFATNKTRILPTSEEALNDLYMYLARNPQVRIRIIGHTDNVGKDAANQKLSEGRAEAVKQDLVERGLNPERLEAEGRGESQPIDTNETEEGRQNNRRVEIEIL